MSRVSRAAFTTSLVMLLSWLMSRMRVIWVKRRWKSRKLPLVMRATAAIASASVKSWGSMVRPISCQRFVRTKASSSVLRVR